MFFNPARRNNSPKRCVVGIKLLPLQPQVKTVQPLAQSQPHPFYQFSQQWRGARVAEEARLESVYTSKAYRGFESPSLRFTIKDLEDVHTLPNPFLV